MSEYYNQNVATHYAAYRPPLHQIILKRILPDTNVFFTGLDVGCGTGYSSTALAVYCSYVYGIDPSQSMLDKAEQHNKITYLKGTGESIPLPDHSVDVITFAGSLFYADLKATADEIRRVCPRNAIVISYDFEILLDDHLQELDIDPDKTDSGYDHSSNFSYIAGFDEILVNQEKITLEVTPAELAHILLSDLCRYQAFAEKYDTEDPFPALEEQLKTVNNLFSITANIYYSKYHMTVQEEN